MLFSILGIATSSTLSWIEAYNYENYNGYYENCNGFYEQNNLFSYLIKT